MRIADAAQSVAQLLGFVLLAHEAPIRDAQMRVVGGNRAGFAYLLRPPAQMRQAVLERAGR